MEAIDGGAPDQKIVPTLAHFEIAKSVLIIDPEDYKLPDKPSKNDDEESLGEAFRDAVISIAEALWVEWGDDLPKELRPTFVDVDDSELRVVEVEDEAG